MSFRKNQIENLREFVAGGYARKSSDWVNGSGKHITRRTIPPYVAEIPASRISKLKGAALRDAKRVLKNHPKTVKILYVSNVREANKLINI